VQSNGRWERLMPLPEITEPMVIQMANDHEYSIGEEYYLSGSVTSIIKGEQYQAAVNGRKRYTVRIWDENGELRTECNCPYEARGVGRHTVALMLSIARQHESAAPFKWFELGERVETPHHDIPHPDAVVPVQSPEATRAPEPRTQTDEKPEENDTPLKLLLARDIMSGNLATLPPKASLADAWELVSKKGFRHIPIVSSEGRLVGIVSDRDLLLKAALVSASDQQSDSGFTVDVIMKTKILTASPYADIRHIARVLFEHHVGAMPIVDEQEKLAGMITRSDILRELIEHHIPA
jgi:acetoin utilization protein AcuB